MTREKCNQHRFKGYLSIYFSSWSVYVIPFVIVSLLCMLVKNGYSVSLGIKVVSEGESIDFYAFGRWGAVMALPIVLDGFYLDILKRASVFVRIRLTGSREFRMLQLLGCVINSLLWGAVVALVAQIVVSNISVSAVLVILSNQLLLGCSYACVNCTSKLPSELSGIAVMAGFSTLHFLNEYGILPLYASPAAWGMVYRSTQFAATGLPIQYMILGNTIVSTLFFFIIITRPIDLEE